MMYIGIDGGGTKTKFVLTDENLNVIDECIEETCHFAQVGYDGMETILTRGIQTLIQRNHVNEVCIGYGLAGYGQEEHIRTEIENVVKKVSLHNRYVLVNDVQSALAGALAGHDGIVMIAGTGSIAFGQKGDLSQRCGGFGNIIGDEGSAFWLSKQMLSIFCKQADGRLPKTKIYDILMKECHLNKDYDMISYVRDELNNDRSKIAQLAMYAYEAAKENDETMIHLYDECAKEISYHINTLYHKMFENEKVNVSYIGGVFKAQDLILQPLKKYLHKNLTLHSPKLPPESGVILLCQKKHL